MFILNCEFIPSVLIVDYSTLTPLLNYTSPLLRFRLKKFAHFRFVGIYFLFDFFTHKRKINWKKNRNENLNHCKTVSQLSVVLVDSHICLTKTLRFCAWIQWFHRPTKSFETRIERLVQYFYYYAVNSENTQKKDSYTMQSLNSTKETVLCTNDECTTIKTHEERELQRNKWQVALYTCDLFVYLNVKWYDVSATRPTNHLQLARTSRRSCVNIGFSCVGHSLYAYCS